MLFDLGLVRLVEIFSLRTDLARLRQRGCPSMQREELFFVQVVLFGSRISASVPCRFLLTTITRRSARIESYNIDYIVGGLQEF